MAKTTIQDNNKLVKFTRQINREFVKTNMYSPYMGTELNSIIRVRRELTDGGEQMNIPLVLRLRGKGKGVGTLAGNEEKIDNYGMRVWIDWHRNAVKTNKSQKHKDSADIFGEARSLLSDWGKEAQRDEMTEAFMALPSESPPAGLGSDDGQRVNGILYEAATDAEKDAWNAANEDRIVYGALVGNFNADHSVALATLDTANDTLSKSMIRLMKSRAKQADPNIRPWMTKDGYEHYVCFAGTHAFRDLKADMESLNQDARPRSVEKNPIFQDGDLLYDGVIIREVEQITSYVDSVWTSLGTAGASSARVEPVFFCGQQAAVQAWGQMARPTFLKEDDYQFFTGAGIEMATGVSKMFKKPQNGTALKQWGVLTGFVAAAADA